MNEFYSNYRIKLLKAIFEELKRGNKEGIKNYAYELKELNKTQFFDKKLILK